MELANQIPGKSLVQVDQLEFGMKFGWLGLVESLEVLLSLVAEDDFAFSLNFFEQDYMAR